MDNELYSTDGVNMPGPLSRPDGVKETQQEKIKRMNGDSVARTGRTATKKRKKIRTEE